MEVERKAELKMLQNVDKVITVNDAISDYFKSLSPNNSEKVVTIPNGFDLDEMGQVFPSDLIWNSEKINLVFTGSFYTNATYLFNALVSALKTLKQELKTLPFHFYFLGPNVNSLKLHLDKNSEADFSFGYYSDLENVNAVIARANYGLLFLTDDINNSLSTKFCEYIKFKKKIIVFSKPGFTGNYVEQNKIGHHFAEKDIEKGLRSLMNKQESFPQEFNIDKFSVKGLTTELMDILNIKEGNEK
jgi:glycosyltransferase involved in cell wall biosynthesis